MRLLLLNILVIGIAFDVVILFWYCTCVVADIVVIVGICVMVDVTRLVQVNVVIGVVCYCCYVYDYC